LASVTPCGRSLIWEAARLGPVFAAWVHNRGLRQVIPPNHRARLAATDRQAAGRSWVTSEPAAVIPYDLSRRWATAFQAARYDGNSTPTFPRPMGRNCGIAIFGPAIPARFGRRPPIAADHRRDIEAGGGVLAPPHSTVLTVTEQA
jgi:hypothetical protein